MNTLVVSEKIAQITPEWVIEQMREFKIKNPRQLSIQANISDASLNRALKGHRELSSEIKNTLYWFFIAKNYERQIQDFER